MPDLHPIDYFVPNFGLDKEESGVQDTLSSINEAERQLGVTWHAITKKPKDNPTDYAVPNFGLDSDIKASLKNLNSMESKYGKWDLPKEE